jgi:VanZ family protein
MDETSSESSGSSFQPKMGRGVPTHPPRTSPETNGHRARQPVVILLRILAWACIVLLAILSLLPAQDMVRTGLPGRFEHVVAYSGAAAIAAAAYDESRRSLRIVGWFWIYAAVLEYLQNYSPGRKASFGDFAASAAGGLCGWIVIDAWRRWAK